MNRSVAISLNVTALLAIGLLSLLAGCEYDVPITAEPTRRIVPALVGDWKSVEVSDESNCRDLLKVRQYDDSTYIVSLNGELHRIYHSDVGETPLVSVQNIDSSKRKFSYYGWRLSEDGKNLTLRMINEKVIPPGTRDSASVVKLLRENATNPSLFADPVEFRKD